MPAELSLPVRLSSTLALSAEIEAENGGLGTSGGERVVRSVDGRVLVHVMILRRRSNQHADVLARIAVW